MTGFFARLTGTDYQGLLLRLLPRGRAWTLDDPGLAGTLLAIGEELARASGRFLDLLDEADVETTDELLDDWRRVFSLPDPCDPSPPTTDAGWRQALHAKLVARGGMQPALVRIALDALGYAADVELQQPVMFRADESAADERVYDYEWASFWYVWAETTPGIGWDRLLCLFRDGTAPIGHSHTRVITIDGLRANEVATPT